MRCFSPAGTLLAVALLSASATAQSWSLLSPTTSPTGRNNHAMCTDTARNVVVLFGGLGSGGDTWEWNGTTWTKMTPATSPPDLGYAGMSFDAARKVCVLFGGRTSSARSAETWEWDGINWKKISTTASPAARYGHAQCYDIVRKVTVVFGGFDTTPYFADTWEYDGINWKQVATTGPIGRIYPNMAYDLTRARSVLFSGYAAGATPSADLQDTWEWNGVSWTEVKVACQPLARWGCGMTYVLGRGVVIYGGQKQVSPNAGTLSDTWSYNGTWSEVRPTNPPSARRLTAMAIDPTTGRPLLFGGSAGASETHTLDLGTFAPAMYEPYGTGCTGTNGTPALGSVDCNAPYINETLTIQLTNVPTSSTPLLIFGLSDTKWGAINLPMDWSFMGFNGCSLQASLDFNVPMSVTGNTATIAVPVPNTAALVGFSFYNQAFVPDSGANPAGGTLSNGVAATVGRR